MPLPSRRLWDVLTVLAGLVLFVVTWATVVITHQVGYAVAPAVAVATVAPLGLVRAYPTAGWGISLVVGLLFWALVDPRPDYPLPWTVPQLVVFFALTIAVALHEPVPRVVMAWAGGTATLAVLLPPASRGGLALGLTGATVVALLVRRLILSQRRLAQQEEVSELERARRAVLEERSRIAHDLHDVVAHRMSLVVVQAQSAPARLGSVRPDVAEEFRSISEQARAALNEVRGMLGVLRSEDAAAPGAPQPGLRELEPLLEQTRAAGVDLTWSVEGDPSGVGEAVSVVVYRIVQEALANASRHAPGSHVEVSVTHGDPVRLAVRSGPSATAATPVDGHGPATGTGLLGMAERARSVGGTLEALPLADGGFLVRATLPPTARAAH
jgi:signal transduction histidine kinase